MNSTLENSVVVERQIVVGDNRESAEDNWSLSGGEVDSLSRKSTH